ncbi:similar to Saccharomyces cerevisiae YER098W UBP9 Ubiquitin carboxyl-terminal hydrolase, ubiquitin-specific protease that cleaves ubiquitin-protein fusions [Maudiozyma saulgeensis]|uniref:ubiquitinyl hydrolase 1 n=1 Tax=Maudiozyma saulgeensis TaxID=1789683 RepID=A0A1X7R4K2_9SACH|nr:similar to Saccharomyces cerevisiae YER098W UBP9 Ubiquitin carboxyl-terminal hydrolase, ubiquitin-specific protease that cleaves ubiquitin-protein fusions [Kazachstania saulgeensis]
MFKRFLSVNKGSKVKNNSSDDLTIKQRSIIDDPLDEDQGIFYEHSNDKDVQVISEMQESMVIIEEVEKSFNNTNPFSNESNNPFKRDIPPLTTSEEGFSNEDYPPIWYSKRTDDLPFGDGSNKVFGFENFGNTCYCNSVLQCLYNHREFRTNVLTYPIIKDETRERKLKIVAKNARTYDNLLQELNGHGESTKLPSGNLTDSNNHFNEEEKSFQQQGKKMLSSFMRRSNSVNTMATSNLETINKNESAIRIFDTVPKESTMLQPADVISPNQINNDNNSRIVIVGRELDNSISKIKADRLPSNGSSNKTNGSTGEENNDNNFNINEKSNDNFERKNSDTQTIYRTIERRKKVALVNGPVLNIDHKISQHDTGSAIFGSLKDIFECITENDYMTGVVSPHQFIHTFKKENVLFNSMMHQDAHEFLNFLLNQISDTNLDSVDNRNAPNFVQDMFQGSLTYRVKCLTCDNITTRDENFLDFPIEVQGKNETNIQDVLEKFHQRELLNGSNKFYCDLCCGLQEAERVVGLKSLPSTLLLHLKRFKYSEAENANIKLFNNIYYPSTLHVKTTFDETQSKNYKMTGLVVHMGGGPQHGHYVALCKTEKYGWLLFDDETIETVSDEDVLKYSGDNGSMSTAYLLMYTEDTNTCETNSRESPTHLENVSELIHADDIVRRKNFVKDFCGVPNYSREQSTEIAEAFNSEKTNLSKNKISEKTSKFFSFAKK